MVVYSYIFIYYNETSEYSKCLRRDKLITFGNNNTQLINNSGKSDIILL